MVDKSDFELEPRAYNEESTPEEIEAIKARVNMYDETIIYYKEVRVITPFSINLMSDEVEKLKGQSKGFGLLFDLRENKIPDARARRIIYQRVKGVTENVTFVACVTGKNTIIKTALKFVLYHSYSKAYGVFSSVEEGIAAIKNAKSE